MTSPNILFLLSDEHSFRCMGHLDEDEGGEPVSTPTFDSLASRGTVFTDAYCQVSLCTPSRLCLLTGLEARRAGAWNNKSILRPELQTLPATLRDIGYATCLVGKMHLGGTQQFVGFQHRPYGDLTGQAGHQSELVDEPNGHAPIRSRTKSVGEVTIPESLIQDQVVAHETVSFLRNHQEAEPEKPWFLCASFSRPHFPLTAPRRHVDRYWPDGVTEPKIPATGDAYGHPMSVGMRQGFQVDEIPHEEMMKARAAYFSGVSYLDEVIGDMFLRLEGSGLLDNTIIVYTSDHGEMAGEHGVWWKNGWYESCTRVPLIISLPAQRRGDMPARSCEKPVGLIDLFPTLCALADAEIPDRLSGMNLSKTVTGEAEAPERAIFCDNLIPRWGEGTEFRMVRWHHYKYVRFRNAPPLFFDLKADPEEQHNLLNGKAVSETRAILDYLRQIAEDSIDFDAAERDRKERDASIQETYKQNVPASTGNLYHMPSGKVINAEDTLYHPTMIDEDGTNAFGFDWQNQNKH